MKLFLIGVVLIFTIGGLLFLIKEKEMMSQAPGSTKTVQENIPEERKASFAIFTNGTFRVFTDIRYHNLSEDVYIDSSSPNVIVVKKSGTTWGDFFKTLPMSVDKDCLTTGTGQTFCSNSSQSLKFYVNGETVPNVLEEEINENDKLLVSYGPAEDPSIEEQLEQVPPAN